MATGVKVPTKVQQEETFLTWRALSRPYRGGGGGRLTVPTVIAGLVGVIMILAGEWMLVGVVVALGFAYWAWTMVPPEEAEYGLTTRGVRMGGRLYEWETLARWWMTEKWGQKLAAIQTPLVAGGLIYLPVGERERARVEEILTRSLLHERPAETVVDRAGRWLEEKFPLEAEKK